MRFEKYGVCVFNRPCIISVRQVNAGIGGNCVQRAASSDEIGTGQTGLRGTGILIGQPDNDPGSSSR